MCGITGYWHPGKGAEADVLKPMMRVMTHRGPDGDGQHLDPERGLAMGHVRLAIIDLEHGEQPLFAGPDNRVVMTANGELYDYKLIRTRLTCEGVRFASKTDSEIALQLYRKHGLSFVDHLRGEFAIAIFDEDAERLILVRDRFGIKPLYVHRSDRGLIWGSEVKCVLQHPTVTPRLSPEAALHQMMQVMAPGTTAFEGVDAVLPGHMLVIDRRGDGLEVRDVCYWDAEFPDEKDIPTGDTDAEVIDGVRDRLMDAVRVRLEADVPVGCYLSGGIDSCSALGLATAMQQSHVRAFTISFDDDAYDEASIAKEMAEKTEAEQVVMPLGRAELYGAHYERTMWHAERTFYNTLAVAKWHMSRRVHQEGYKVVITGEGSDELFGGYPFFKKDFLKYCVPAEERGKLLAALGQSNAVFQGAILADEALSHPAMEDLVGFTPTWLHPWIGVLERVRPLFAAPMQERLKGYDPVGEIAARIDPAALRGRHPLDKVQYTWIKTMLEGQILTWGGDRVDMANSMESRPPFLDHLLAEYAFHIPPDARIRGMREKWVLREAMREVLPPVLYEREKFAFMAPPATIDTVRRQSLQPLVERYLSESALKTAGLFDPHAVAQFIARAEAEEDRARSVQDDIVLNHLLGLQMLDHQYVQGAGAPSV